MGTKRTCRDVAAMANLRANRHHTRVRCGKSRPVVSHGEQAVWIWRHACGSALCAKTPKAREEGLENRHPVIARADEVMGRSKVTSAVVGSWLPSRRVIKFDCVIVEPIPARTERHTENLLHGAN